MEIDSVLVAIASELGSSPLTPSGVLHAMRRMVGRVAAEPLEQLCGQVHCLVRFMDTPDVELAAGYAAALTLCIQDAAADSDLEEPLPHVLSAMRGAEEHLGSALRQPGMMAATAALDADAVPALCILVLASSEACRTEAPGEASNAHLLLQPATMECLRLVARGGAAPLLSQDLSAVYALELAESCCRAGDLHDEAPLLQVLHNCSAALLSDVLARATELSPAADASTAAAAHAVAGPSAAAAVYCGGGGHPAAAAPQQPSGRGGHADDVQLSEQLSAQQPAADNAEQQLQPVWHSAWAPPVMCALETLATLHQRPRRGTGGALPAPQQPCTEVSPASVVAYTAGMEALLAHEAALQRGPVTGSHKALTAILKPFRTGESAAAAQQALFSGLMDALEAALNQLPAEKGSALPTAAQAAALSRLATLARFAVEIGEKRDWPVKHTASVGHKWAATLAAVATAAAFWACQESDSIAGSGIGVSGSAGSGGEADRGGAKQTAQQQERRQRHGYMQQAASYSGKALQLLLPPAATSSVDALEQEPVPSLLTALAKASGISPASMAQYVQARAEEVEDSDAETELSIRGECMRDLKAAAAVLEAAVVTVAAAAEKRARRQPSDHLVAVCCTAVRALLGLTTLQIHSLRYFAHATPGLAEEFRQALQRRAELANRLVRARGPSAAAQLGAATISYVLRLAIQLCARRPLPAPALQPLLAALRAAATLLRPASGPTQMQAVCQTSWQQDDLSSWYDYIMTIAEELLKEESPRRQALLLKGLREVKEALQAAASAAECAASADASSGADLGQKQATADAAMQDLLAAEEGGTAAAAAPSKAAEKRARKKAAARAAAAAAAAALPLSAAEGPSEHGQDDVTAAHAASGDTAARLQRMSLADGAAVQADPSAGSTTKRDSSAAAAGMVREAQQQPQPWMLCPITQEVMVRPTLCVGDGHSYEQAAISQWLRAHTTSPVTGQQLATADLLPNHALRQIIEASGH